MVEVNSENYDQEVLKEKIPVVVDIWGPKCGPCLALMPSVEALSASYEGRVKFCKLNSAENRRLVMSLKVMGVPTFLFYKNGVLSKRLTGEEVTLDSIKQEVEALFS